MLSVSLIIDFWYKHLSLMLQGRLEETSLRESSLFSVEWVAGRNFKKDKGGFLATYFLVHFYSIISLFVLMLIIRIVTIYSDVSIDVIIIARFVSKT